jgi:peptidoglycan hydrolase CwlO-like protein
MAPKDLQQQINELNTKFQSQERQVTRIPELERKVAQIPVLKGEITQMKKQVARLNALEARMYARAKSERLSFYSSVI